MASGEQAAEEVELKARKIQHALWAKQEDIAMHFNELTMRLRLQALAGIGAAVVAAGTVFTHEGVMSMKPIGCFLMAMALVWLGIFLLDALYYQRLLKGAVASIKEIEAGWSEGRLSSLVETQLGFAGRVARYAFYLIVFGLLSGSGWWASHQKSVEFLQSTKKDPPTPAIYIVQDRAVVPDAGVTIAPKQLDSGVPDAR